MYPIIYGKSPFEIPPALEVIRIYIEDMQLIPVSTGKLGDADTCKGCVFKKSILCMYAPDCEHIIFKVKC